MNAPSAADAALDPVVPPGLVSARAKLVYLYLASVGAATADELQTALRESLLSLYKILGALLDLGLVECRGDRYMASVV